MNTRRAQAIVSRLLEAGPDDVDPRAALKALPGNYWIVSFDNVREADGSTFEPALDYPILAGTEQSAVEKAKRELTQANYDLTDAFLIQAWIAEENDWKEIKKIWDTYGQGASAQPQ